NLLALRTAPQRDVQIGERDAGVVTDAAHDQVISDQQSVFHGAGRDHASLTNRAIDQHKNQSDPDPGDDFATGALADSRRMVVWLLFAPGTLFGFSFHVPP